MGLRAQPLGSAWHQRIGTSLWRQWSGLLLQLSGLSKWVHSGLQVMVRRLALLWSMLMNAGLASVLAFCSSVQMGMLAFYGMTLPEVLEIVGMTSSSPYVMPLALVTFAVVFLVELSLLTLMTQKGMTKFHGQTTALADSGSGVDIVVNQGADHEHIVHLTPQEAGFYRSRADIDYRDSWAEDIAGSVRSGVTEEGGVFKYANGLIIKEVDGYDKGIRLHTKMQVDAALEGVCDFFEKDKNEDKHEAVKELRACIYQLLPSENVSKGSHERNKTDCQRAYMRMLLWHKLAQQWHEKSHHEGTRDERADSKWFYTVFNGEYKQAEREVLGAYHSNKVGDGCASLEYSDKHPMSDAIFGKSNQERYRRRKWLMLAVAGLVIVPAAVVVGALGFVLLTKLGWAAAVGLGVQYAFAVCCGLGYFYQLYQSVSFLVLSDALRGWWQHWHMTWQYICKEEKVFMRALQLFMVVVLTLLFLTISLIATICTAGEFIKMVGKDGAWWTMPATIALYISEGLYGLVWTAKSHRLLNQGVAPWLAKRGPGFGKRCGDFFSKQAQSFTDTFCSGDKWGCYLLPRLLFAAPAWVLCKVNSLVVASFEFVLFIGHAALLGLQGVDNPHFEHMASALFGGANEVTQDAGLYFDADDEHDHGVFDLLCRLMYMVITLAPALAAAGLYAISIPSGRPATDCQRYQTVFMGHKFRFSAYDFRYLWGKNFLEFSVCESKQQETQSLWATFTAWMKKSKNFLAFAKVAVVLALIACTVAMFVNPAMPMVTGLLWLAHTMMPFVPAAMSGAAAAAVASATLVHLVLMAKLACSLLYAVGAYVCRGKGQSMEVAKEKIGCYQEQQAYCDQLSVEVDDNAAGANLIKRQLESTKAMLADRIEKLQYGYHLRGEPGQDAPKKRDAVSDESIKAWGTKLQKKRFSYGTSKDTASYRFFKEHVKPVFEGAMASTQFKPVFEGAMASTQSASGTLA